MPDLNIIDFGAVSDGKTLNTMAIQKAIDQCHLSGGGRVVCGSGCYKVGSIFLKSNVELYLENGCRLLGSERLEDYVDLKAPGFINDADKTAEKSSRALINAVVAENIAVTGQGTLDGNGLRFYKPGDFEFPGKFEKPASQRPRIAMLYGCRNIRIQDISCVDSSCWTFWLMKCEDVTVNRIRISGNSMMRNIDGIDIDSCRNVVVSDCIMDTEDDCIAVRSMQKLYDEPAVCENIAVTNCVFKTKNNGIRIGCPCDATVRNCVFTNILIEGYNGIVIQNPARYLARGSSGSADIHDISFSDITVSCSNYPVELYVEEGIELKRLSDISFSNLRTKSGGPFLIKGSSQTVIKRVNFNNIRAQFSGEESFVCLNCEDVSFDGIGLFHKR